MHLTIPAHAFDYLDLKEHTCTATNLLTDSKQKLTLKRDGQLPLTLQPRGALVLKF
jgi:hypothetical protein